MVKRIGAILFFVVAAHCAATTGMPGLAFADTRTQDGQPCPPECVSDSMEIVTWYPSPYNEYEELRLYPKRSAEESQCNSFEQLGLMYYNQDEQALKVCWQDPGDLSYSWEKITLGQGGYWAVAVSGNDIYNTNSGNIGVGINSPTVKLDVDGTIKAAGFKMPTGAQAGYVLMTDGSGNASWQQLSGGGSNFSNMKQFTGNQSWQVPSGVTQIMVEVWGAGGGGGGGVMCGYCWQWYGNASGGGGGGSSSFGSLISAGGGGGGMEGGTCGGCGNPGSGGTSSASINVSGQAGSGSSGGTGGFGAGSGGSGGCNCQCGGGGGGGAYGKGIFSVTAGSAYSVIVGQGGGGGGGQSGACGSSPSGNLGGNGRVVVYW